MSGVYDQPPRCRIAELWRTFGLEPLLYCGRVGGEFLSARMKPAEYLSFYATRFDAVELDNTFYATPALSTVKGWYARTPPGFLFAAKVPQVITPRKSAGGLR